MLKYQKIAFLRTLNIALSSHSHIGIRMFFNVDQCSVKYIQQTTRATFTYRTNARLKLSLREYFNDAS
jgi:hypothetical protein